MSGDTPANMEGSAPLQQQQPENDDMMMMDENEDQVAPMQGEFDDDAPLFLGEGDAVEVPVDDTNVPMDDDDDDDEAAMEQQQQEPVVDMARVVIESHTDPVYAVACAMTHNGSILKLVSGGGDDKAFWHEIDTSQQQQQQCVKTTETQHPFKDSVSTVASNAPFVGFDTTKPPNPEWMAVGGLDGSVVLFGNDNNQVLALEGPSSDIEWLCWHPKGGNVLLVGCADATIWMYHTTLNKCLQVFVGHEEAVTCGAFSADGKVALSGSADGTLRIWGPRVGKCKHVFRFASDSTTRPPALTCLATHGGTDQQLVLVGAEDGQAHVCHVASKKHVASLRHYDPTTTNNFQQQSADDEEDDDDVMLPSGVEAVGFCRSNPNWCATGGMDGVLKIWDLANQGQCRHTCRRPNNSSGGITQLTWHPTVPLVLTSTTSGQVELWDARNGQLLQTLTGHADVINDMDVSFVPGTTAAMAGHAVVVTASDDKTVRIFHVDIDATLAAPQQQQ